MQLRLKVRLPEINVVKNSGLLSGHGIKKVDGALRITVNGQTQEFRKADSKVEVFTILHGGGVLTGAEIVDKSSTTFKFEGEGGSEVN